MYVSGRRVVVGERICHWCWFSAYGAREGSFAQKAEVGVCCLMLEVKERDRNEKLGKDMMDSMRRTDSRVCCKIQSFGRDR